MNAVGRVLTRPIVAAALAGAFLAWAIVGTWAAVLVQRNDRAVLDAASAALRPALASAGAAGVRAHLSDLREALDGWSVDAAAFDRNGSFIAGDAGLRDDGLPKGADAAPPAGRQLSIVPTRDGYVLLRIDPAAVLRFRVMLGGGLLGSLLAAGLAAFLAGAWWARERARVLLHAREHLVAIADGRSRSLTPLKADPLFGDFLAVTSAAIDRLAHAVSDRSDAEERLRTFLADAGHELRTPLAIVTGYVGILKRGALGDAALAERIVADISEQLERLKHLVEGILQLARLDAIAQDAQASADVVRVAAEAVALVRPLDVERHITIEGPPSAWAAIGGDDLRDALRNVLENAILYAPAAPISIVVDAGEAGVAARVRDAGPGMDPFTAAHAFDRFFRGAERGAVPGTGLGLAIVRRIVDRAGGRITLESSPGGTTVELHLRAPQRLEA